jgi:hypothetical protein
MLHVNATRTHLPLMFARAQLHERQHTQVAYQSHETRSHTTNGVQ